MWLTSMRSVLAVVTGTLILVSSLGCYGPGVYSSYEKEVPNVAAKGNPAQIVSRHGPPDQSASVGNYTVMIWRGYDSMSVYDKILTGFPLFQTTDKSDLGVVVNADEEITAAGRSRAKNESKTILGVFSVPVGVWND